MAKPDSRDTSKQARAYLKETQKLFRRGHRKLAPPVVAHLRGAMDRLEQAIRSGDTERMTLALQELDPLVEMHLALFRKSTSREYIESIGFAVIVALCIRAFLLEAFKIPSGSMLPTLHVGDQIFVNKLAYGIRIPFTSVQIVELDTPKRGDVIVFRYPLDPKKDFIKRVVGVPGDTIQLRGNALYINGELQPRYRRGPMEVWDNAGQWKRERAEAFEETLGEKTVTVLQSSSLRAADYGPIEVQPGHVFVMGDNRDNSHDSRRWCEQGGSSTACQVPMENILGEAMFIWFSWGRDGVDFDRFFMSIE